MSDFFERARSAGVIGVTVMIFLLIGFGALFMAVFDDRLNGENATKLKETVREQEFELYGLEDEINWAQANLIDQKRIEGIYKELATTTKELDILTRKETELVTELEEEKKAFEEVAKEQLAYRDEYRKFVRAKAIGESYEELTLGNGKVLKNVKIRQIMPDKIRFTTEFGSTNVTWEDAPDALRERFQIGEGELEAHQANLAKMREQRNKLAAEGRSERGVYLREVELKKTLTRITRTLDEKIKNRNRARLSAAAFRAKAKEHKTKSYNTTHNVETNRRLSIKAEKDADILDSKITMANEQIRTLEMEKAKTERELEKVKKDR